MNVQKTVSALAAVLVLAGAVSLPALAAEQTAPAPESAAHGYPLKRNGAAAAADVPVRQRRPHLPGHLDGWGLFLLPGLVTAPCAGCVDGYAL